MKFKYQKLRSSKTEEIIYRPIIHISIASDQGKTQDYFVLVDSGADNCIFDAEIGEIIGLKIKEGELKKVYGVGGKSINVYFHNIFISVGGHEYPLKCGFSYEMAQNGYGLLGQIGFFDKFKVIFDYTKKIIELRPK